MKTLLATTAFVLAAGLTLSGASLAQAQDRDTESAPFAQSAMPGDLMTRELMGRDVYARPDGVDPGEVIVPADWDGQGLPLFHADELDDIAIIGVIDDILLDDAGQMQLIVVDKHGLLGIGGRTIAIDAANTQFATTSRDDPAQILLLTDVSVEDAENAPDFEPGEVSDRIGTRERLEAEDIVD
ncbi:MAG: PRC-barrel domain-containing protein [Salinarimonas sp.]|nr:PRC-barrel domain-containing protein [Salinarimonas sp.]